MDQHVALSLSSWLFRSLSTLCIGVASIALPAIASGADPYYLRSDVGRPWEDSGGMRGNEPAMDDVFGAGSWIDGRYESVDANALFAEPRFIFMEGSDNNADELEAFLTANRAALEAFVKGGGVVFLNSAPNEGDGMDFALGVTLIFGDHFCNADCNAVVASHPIFDGPFTPVVRNYSGFAFSHGVLSGTFTPLMQNAATGETMLGELHAGRGLAIFGGMTISDFHEPQPEADNLRRNILAYGAAHVRAAPPSIALAPEAEADLIQTPRAMVAHTWDAKGPAAGIPVLFFASGANSAAGAATTDAEGNASFSYVGNAVGVDAIVACVDDDADGKCSPEEPSATASTVWSAPPQTEPPTACSVYYWGLIQAAPRGTGAFSGFAKQRAGVLKGMQFFEYFGAGTPFRMSSVSLDSLVCSDDSATLEGHGLTGRGARVTYQIDLREAPGMRGDRYRIRLSNGYDSGERCLFRGDVEVRRP